MAIRTVEEIDVRGKRVLVRCDFNVPLDKDLHITDENRITAALPTVRFLLEKKAKVILMSHMDRPKGKVVPEMSLKPVAENISMHLGIPVRFVPESIGLEVERAVKSMIPGEVTLLENLRFHKEETDNDPAFAKTLASYGEVFVNNDFGTAHRAQASTVGITNFIGVVACGYLLKKEIEYLKDAVANPKRPFVVIVGGSKISSKIGVILKLLDKADSLLIGGAMTYTFFKAMGLEIGNSLYEEDKVMVAQEIMDKADSSGCDFVLPVDCMIASSFSGEAEVRFVDRENIPVSWVSPDIGPKTIELYSSKIKKAAMAVWNGPMGAFEIDAFAGGTKAIARSLADATSSGTVTIIGGGDTSAALAQFGLQEKMTYVSTGGGASLELLEGKVLPGMQALDK
jgi:phosphoglycerate kinase